MIGTRDFPATHTGERELVSQAPLGNNLYGVGRYWRGKIMLDDATRRVLLVETHNEIRKAASKAAALVGSADLTPKSLVYPPERDVLTGEELEALGSIALTNPQRSALTKLIADAAANAFFGVFALMDAVREPELVTPGEAWEGIDLSRGIPDVPSFPMLHDELFESYSRFTESRKTGPRDAP